jgi:hypothetical protein
MKRILIGLVVLFLAAGAAVSLYINQIVGGAIERGASYALGVDTRVGFVRLRLLPADFRLRRLRIANPPGFDEPRFLALSSAEIDVARETLLEDVVVIPLFALDDIDVALEREGKQTNYGVILENLSRFESGEPPAQEAEPYDAGSERRFIVKRLVISDVTAHVEWSGLASDQSALKVVIPQIELKDIGAHNAQGVVMSEFSAIVMKAILGSIARYGTDLPGVMLGELNKGLGGVARVPGVVVTGMGGNLVEAAGAAVGGETGDAIRGVGGSAVESVGEAVGDEAAKALGGLFGGKKEKD